MLKFEKLETLNYLADMIYELRAISENIDAEALSISLDIAFNITKRQIHIESKKNPSNQTELKQNVT